MTSPPPRTTVLITRPEPGATETANRVTAMGLTPIVAPLMEIRLLPVRPPAGRIAAILLTSGNAIAPLPVSSRALPVLTVGEATARRAEQAGFTNVTSAGGDAESLAALVRREIRPTEGMLLLAAGRGQSLALAAALRMSGYRVARRAAYAAIPVAHLPASAKAVLTSEIPPTILLFSAETARHFVCLARRAGLAGALAGCEAVTIGQKAAMALSAVPWARIRVARKPTQDDMLALLR